MRLPDDRRPTKEPRHASADLPKTFFARDVDSVARALVGMVLTFGGVGGTIVETESYDSDDPASHCYGRRLTPRNRTMFGPPGHAYVYRSYGIHWCLNFTCGDCSAVLIRALEPLYGIDRMRAHRGVDDVARLCAGPGRLCEALGITGAEDGHSLYAPPFSLYRGGRKLPVCTGVRIGITRARDAQRRFGLASSPFLSRRFPEQL